MPPLRERLASAGFGGLGVFLLLRTVLLTTPTTVPESIFWLAVSAEAFSLALAPSVLFARVSLSPSTDGPGLTRYGSAAAMSLLAKAAFLLSFVAWLLPTPT